MSRQTAPILAALASCGFAAWREAHLPSYVFGEIRWPSSVRIVHSFSGARSDHLGIGLAALGDVNGDGLGDYALGAMKQAYCIGFGPGYVRVHSGRDGSVLYRVDGTDGEQGDAYGDTISSIGDIDGDDRPDWAAGAWRWNGYNGYVVVYSGATGGIIYRLGR